MIFAWLIVAALLGLGLLFHALSWAVYRYLHVYMDKHESQLARWEDQYHATGFDLEAFERSLE